MTEKKPVISLEAARKSYPAFELGPIDLEIEPGCFVAIVGPKGGGKSTLMGMLMNLVKPTSGKISLFGGNYPTDEVAIKQRIGYVPERTLGYDDLSPKALRKLVSHFYPGWDQRLYEDLLADVAIEPGKKFGKLSGETRRLLIFALAAATGSELLLLDEPTAGVDLHARRRILEGASHFMKDGRYGDRTVVFTTRVTEEVPHLADYVAFLAEGKLLGIFEKDAILQGWKVFWSNTEPEGDVPGVIEIESGDLTRIVSDSSRETEEALWAQNVRIVQSRALNLEEILSHLMRPSEERRIESSHTGE